MRISHRFENEVCVISIRDDLAFQEVGPAKEYLLQVLDEDDPEAVILNMAGVKNLDSSGIALLMMVFKSVQNPPQNNEEIPDEEKRFAICCLGNSAFKVLKTIQLHVVFPLYETEEEALSIISGFGPLVSHQVSGNIGLIQLEKNLTSRRVVEVEDFVLDLVASTPLTAVVLDFEGVMDIDSTGIGFIMGLYNSLMGTPESGEARHPSRLSVCHLNPGIKKVFSMLALDAVLDNFDSSDAAIEALKTLES